MVGDGDIDVVVSPAVGGIVIGYMVARHLRKRMVFAERVDGKLTLRRGQELAVGERALIVEDVITTGGSVLEVATLCRERNAVPLGIAALVERGSKVDLQLPKWVLIDLEKAMWQPEECPLCQGSVPIDSPGSRHL
jgi:orotate phosphoribosyltransferase